MPASLMNFTMRYDSRSWTCQCEPFFRFSFNQSAATDFQRRVNGQERGQRGEHQRQKLACDQWILLTSVKYDREPSKSTWQAHGQVQDFTSNEKNEPHAAQTKVRLSFWLATLVGAKDRRTDKGKEHGFFTEKDKEFRGFKRRLLTTCEGLVDFVAVAASL